MPGMLHFWVYPLSSTPIFNPLLLTQRGFPGGSVLKNLPAIQELQEMWVWSLGREDPLEEGMATYPNMLAWRILWTEEPGGLQSMGSQRVRHDWSNLAHTLTHRKVWPLSLSPSELLSQVAHDPKEWKLMGDKRSTNIHKIKKPNWVTNSIGTRGIITDRLRIYIYFWEFNFLHLQNKKWF